MKPPAENLRTGFTTGACAAAATKGALLALIRQQPIDCVTICLPDGASVTFDLHASSFTDQDGRASVIKDAGDDPDVTDKAEICSRVTWCVQPGVTFSRGVGVGLVTRKGLPVPPGEPAINPAPRKLIAETVQEVLEQSALADRGVSVEISVPRGEELARKTFNPRLGIVDGISILGTTGIVIPYSTSAWLASVTQEIDVAVAGECKRLIFVVGERGERTARKQFPEYPFEAFVQVGPFFGDALRHCAKSGIERVILVSMIGKLAKFAAGNDLVHSTSSEQDFAFLGKLARQCGAGPDLIAEVARANTAQEVSALIRARGLPKFFDLLCEHAWHFGSSLVGGDFPLAIHVTDPDGNILGRWPKDEIEPREVIL